MSSRAKDLVFVTEDTIALKIIGNANALLNRQETPDILRENALGLQTLTDSYQKSVRLHNEVALSIHAIVVNDACDEVRYQYLAFKRLAKALLHYGIATPQDVAPIIMF